MLSSKGECPEAGGESLSRDVSGSLGASKRKAKMGKVSCSHMLHEGNLWVRPLNLTSKSSKQK